MELWVHELGLYVGLNDWVQGVELVENARRALEGLLLRGGNAETAGVEELTAVETFDFIRVINVLALGEPKLELRRVLASANDMLFALVLGNDRHRWSCVGVDFIGGILVEILRALLREVIVKGIVDDLLRQVHGWYGHGPVSRNLVFVDGFCKNSEHLA